MREGREKGESLEIANLGYMQPMQYNRIGKSLAAVFCSLQSNKLFFKSRVSMKVFLSFANVLRNTVHNSNAGNSNFKFEFLSLFDAISASKRARGQKRDNFLQNIQAIGIFFHESYTKIMNSNPMESLL